MTDVIERRLNDLEERLAAMADSLAKRYKSQSKMTLNLERLTALAESNLASHCNQSRFSEELLYQLSIILRYITLPWYKKIFEGKSIKRTKNHIDRLIKSYGSNKK